MFWNRQKPIQQGHFPHPFRFCDLYISDRYKQILFASYGKTGEGFHTELQPVIVDSWPCQFQDLMANIERALKGYIPKAVPVRGKWPSYDSSKATSQKSFEAEYVRIRLETDMTASYGHGEAERIKVSAHPTPLDTTYCLTGCRHLIETNVAQVVVDIFEACTKIRNN
jgi:hypothetical protein